MATLSVTDRWEMKIYVDFRNAGFSESYLLPDDTPTNIKPRAARLISARADILAKGFDIPHVSLGKFSVKRDSYRPATYRSGPINLATEATAADIAGCNDPEVGPIFRFDTGTGKYVNRVLRALRDAQIVDNASLNQTPTISTLAACDAYAGAVAATTTHVAARDMYLSMVLRYTRHYSKFGATLAGSFDETDFASIQYRRVGSHDTGERFRSTAGRQQAWD